MRSFLLASIAAFTLGTPAFADDASDKAWTDLVKCTHYDMQAQFALDATVPGVKMLENAKVDCKDQLTAYNDAVTKSGGTAKTDDELLTEAKKPVENE